MEIRESTKQTAIAAATAAAAADDEKDEREDDAGNAAEKKQDRGENDQPAPDAASNNKVGEEVEAPGAPYPNSHTFSKMPLKSTRKKVVFPQPRGSQKKGVSFLE